MPIKFAGSCCLRGEISEAGQIGQFRFYYAEVGVIFCFMTKRIKRIISEFDTLKSLFSFHRNFRKFRIEKINYLKSTEFS